MGRSYRGPGLVVLMLLVVAPLALFAVLALFEHESADSIKVSLDGEHWTSAVDGALLTTAKPWTPGQTRSAIVYVRNGGPAPVDAEVTVLCRSDDVLVLDGYLALTTQVGQAPGTSFPVAAQPHKVEIDGLAAESTVPLTVAATFDDGAPIGTTVDSSKVWFELEIKGARSERAGAPSLLDAAGAQLWLAPILLVAAAGVAVRVQSRRSARASNGDTSD
jgi:hypothetical protein